MCICVFLSDCVCMSVCEYVERPGPGLPQGSEPQEPPLPPSIENWPRKLLATRPAIQVVSLEQPAFLTGPKSWGREVQLEGYVWTSWVYLESVTFSWWSCFILEI